LTNLTLKLFLEFVLGVFDLALDLSNNLALDFFNLILGLRNVLGNVLFKIFNSLSNGRHHTFPFRFLFVVHRSDNVEVFLLSEPVKLICAFNPIHVDGVHLRLGLDSVVHAFFHNS